MSNKPSNRDTIDEFVKHIRHLRFESSYAIDTLSGILDVDLPTTSHYISGHIRPTHNEALRKLSRLRALVRGNDLYLGSSLVSGLMINSNLSGLVKTDKVYEVIPLGDEFVDWHNDIGQLWIKIPYKNCPRTGSADYLLVERENNVKYRELL